MKKILIILILIFVSQLNIAFGAGGGPDAEPDRASTTSAGTSKTVIVTEMVPGADCTCITTETYSDGKASDEDLLNGKSDIKTRTITGDKACNVSIEKRKYQCTIEPGFKNFQLMFAQIIRWFIFIVMLLGVLGIVGLGIAWAWAGGDDVKAKGNLKKWGINIAIGLVILFFFRYILTIIAPWIYN